ncbi:MAG: MBG domain-containing protein, partial [Bacteroidales bacterium]|nr:MBG domain-containing protein [Bacteroidales bacterium]
MKYRKLLTFFAVLMFSAFTASAQNTSSITIDGKDYTLYTGFTATSGNGISYECLVDGNTSTNWSATKKWGDDSHDDFNGGTEDPAYVEFHSDAAFIPKGYVLTCENEDAGFWKPVSWAFKAKLNEDDEWTTIQTSTTTLGKGKTFQIPCSNDANNKYQYFRFEVYEVGTTRVVSLDELEFYGFENLTYTHLTEMAATCAELGIKVDCYQRNDGKYFTDETGATELNANEVEIPMIPHTGVEHIATENTIHYWQCSVCSKYFSDAGCTNEITESQTQVVKYLAADGTLTRLNVDATAVTSTMTSWSNGWYVVYDDVTIDDRISVSGTVHLILCNGATLTASEGITVGSSASFNIYAQSEDEATMGSLVATATHYSYNSAIGGCKETSFGTININGGKIIASTSSSCGAAIGGSYQSNGDNITINGGIITATAGEYSYGAGIGGGDNGYVSNITLNGGIINATGDPKYGGAGIGTGAYAGNGNMTITITNNVKGIVASNGYSSDCIGKESHSKTTVNVVFKHNETSLTTDEQKAEYFTIIEGNRLIIVPKANLIVNEIPNQTYTGSEITPEPLVTIGSLTLILGTDYEVAYSDNTNAGTAKATIKGINLYKEVEFTIAPAPVTVTAENKTKTFGESDPEFTANVSGLVNNESPDLIKYTFSRTEGENAGEYTITPKGDEKQGNYVVSFVDATLTITKATPNPEPEPQPEPDPQNPSTPVSSIDNGGNNVKVWSYAHTIYIASTPDSQYKIIDLQGRTIKSATTKSSYEEVNINNSGIYVVIINGKSYKVS